MLELRLELRWLLALVDKFVILLILLNVGLLEPLIDDGLYGWEVLNGLLDCATGSGLKADRTCSVLVKVTNCKKCHLNRWYLYLNSKSVFGRMMDYSPIRVMIFEAFEHVTVLKPYLLMPLFPEILLRQRHKVVVSHRHPFRGMFHNIPRD